MTKREAMEINHQQDQLAALGVSYEDADALRRISMTLRRWFERECGDGSGCIERDEKSQIPYWYRANHSYLDPHDPRARYRIPDREAGAKRRLAAIMAKYPHLTPYIQGDPRGCSLYILRPQDLSSEHSIDSIYTRGIAVA